jgi:hypothetical protein
MMAFARTFLEFNVRFEQPLPGGAKIFAPNHPTTTDPFLMSWSHGATDHPGEQTHSQTASGGQTDRKSRHHSR